MENAQIYWFFRHISWVNFIFSILFAWLDYSNIICHVKKKKKNPETHILHGFHNPPAVCLSLPLFLFSESHFSIDLYSHILFHCASQILFFGFFWLLLVVVVNQLKLCGNSALSKSSNAICPAIFVHFEFLCHILVILSVSHTFLLLLYFLW